MSPSSRLFSAALVAFISLASSAQGADDKVLMCYVSQWSVYRRGPGAFSMASIDPSLCTHLIYAYVGLDGNDFTVKSRDPNGESNQGKKGLISQIVDMKKSNPDLMVLFSIGGWSEGSINFSNMVANRRKRATFISSVLEYIRVNKFDGMDLAWCYPGDRGGTAADKDNLISLLKEVRARFDLLGYQLTIQLEARQHLVDIGYDVAQISKYVHYMNVLSFQYKTPWDMQTGANAPLNSTDVKSVAFSVDYLIEKGASPEKMLLGMPAYGHPFVMKAQPSAPGKYMGVASGDIIQGKWSTEGGFVGYNEVCDDLRNEAGWTEHWDDESSTPYAVKGNILYSYDNVPSIHEKLKLLFRKRLGGAMVMSIDSDDFSGRCYGERFPLTRAVQQFFKEHKGKSPTNKVFVYASEGAAAQEPDAEKEDDIVLYTIPTLQSPVRKPNRKPVQPPVQRPTRRPSYRPVLQSTPVPEPRTPHSSGNYNVVVISHHLDMS